MFGFDADEARLLGSAGRYQARIEKFRRKGVRFPKARHYVWWVIHNLLAHGGLAVWPCSLTFRFHDWTSRKLNAE